MMDIEIRKVTSHDISQLKIVLDTIELFPSDMLESLMEDYLTNNETEHLWFTAVQNNTPISVGYCAPEELTEGTYNLYAIGVRKDIQGKGIGRKMMSYVENQLRKAGHRILIVETSGTDEFELTREFYHKLGYAKEAVIRDFWADNDDKVIFRKRL